MSAKTVFMFSGQGSQYFQMGRALFNTEPVFQHHMRRLDDLVRELSGSSVLEAIYGPRADKHATFDRTLLTHPAIFMVEYSLAQSLICAGVLPDMVLGTSLGTFAAAAVAGFVAVEDALAAIVRQALALEQFCEPGGMVAVLADPALFRNEFLSSRCELAAVSFASHFVVSARRADCIRIESDLLLRGVPWQRLPVSFAFHSRWIDGARRDFESFMQSITLGSGELALVCCEQAAILGKMRHDQFWSVTRQPIRFVQAVAELERSGPYRYIDAGPAGTLATFLKYALGGTSASTVHTILTPFDRDQRNWASLTGSPP